MIAFLKGNILEINEDHLVVDVQGVGYEVLMSKTTLLTIGQLGDEIILYIHTHFTDSHLQLFGFLNPSEKTVFRKLITVSGIGPKLATTIVSSLPFEALVGAVTHGDTTTLTSISGVGKKTAERLVVELKDKFKDLVAPSSSANIQRVSVGESSIQTDAIRALMSLGYSENLAKRAIQNTEITTDDTVQTLIKKSLGALSS